MKILPQLLAILAIGAVAVPVAARFVPGTHPWLDRAGLLQPLRAIGLAPAPDETAAAKGGGASAGGPVPVIAAAPQRQVLRDQVTAIGSARGVQSVVLTPDVSGRITALRAAPGQRVTAGEVIVELDSEQAQLAADRARLVWEDAKATLERLEKLTGSGATTALQIQEAQLALRTADLALKTAERDLADHRLVAPIAGVVGLIEVQTGDLVSPSTVVTRIEDRSSLIVDFRVPERVATLVKPGDPVLAEPISTPGQQIRGVIGAIDNRVDETSRSLRVQAQIGNDRDDLRAGMAFRMVLDFTGAEYAAVDPLSIQWGADGAYVWVARQGKAQRLPIRILQRNADAVLVDVVLEPGDLVITEGVQMLRPGGPVDLAGGAGAPGAGG